MKSFKNVIPLFILNNINGANIEADKITVIDLMTFKEYKTNQKDYIDVGIKGISIVNIINSKLFKTTNNENLHEINNIDKYKVAFGKYEDKTAFYLAGKLENKICTIFIAESDKLTTGNIEITFNDKKYTSNCYIRYTDSDEKINFFKIAKENISENDILKLLITNELKFNNKDQLLNVIKPENIDKYFISSLKIGGTEKTLDNNTITKDQLFEIRNAILTNKKIELSLDLLKKVNLKYDTTNLRDNIKTSIEMALNKYISGHVITAPTYIEIITYINTLTRNKLTDLVEKGTNTSHNSDTNNVDLNKTYTIILDKSCYQKPGEDPSKNKFCFGFHFKIANNLKDSTEFANDNFNDDSKDSYENNDYKTIYNIVVKDLKKYNTSITDNDFEILLNDSKIKITDTFKSGVIFTVVIKNKVEGILKDKVKDNNNNNNNNNNTENDGTDEKNDKKGRYCNCKNK